MKFKCKLLFLIVITFLFGCTFYRVRYLKNVLEKNSDLELGVVIKLDLPQFGQSAIGNAIRNGRFNASEFINREKDQKNNFLRFESGKPSLPKFKIFEKCMGQHICY